MACLTKFDDLRSVGSIVARHRIIVGIRLRFQQTEATKEEYSLLGFENDMSVVCKGTRSYTKWVVDVIRVLL